MTGATEGCTTIKSHRSNDELLVAPSSGVKGESNNIHSKKQTASKISFRAVSSSKMSANFY
jgi:hypothetical protein